MAANGTGIYEGREIEVLPLSFVLKFNRSRNVDVMTFSPSLINTMLSAAFLSSEVSFFIAHRLSLIVTTLSIMNLAKSGDSFNLSLP